MAKHAKTKSPTIVLDNWACDAQYLLGDRRFADAYKVLAEAVNRLYLEDNFGGLSLKLSRDWSDSSRPVPLVECRFCGREVAKVTIEFSDGIALLGISGENLAVAPKDLKERLYIILRCRAQALEFRMQSEELEAHLARVSRS